jgi:hypothetical protein
VVDAYGLVSVALDRHSAAGELGLEAGTELRLDPLEETDGVSTALPFPTTRREA